MDDETRSGNARPRTDVLVVDDDEDLREVMSSLLEVEGYETRSAASAGDALRLLGKGLRPSLIIVDWMMPEMDGGEFLERVRSDPSLLGIPVVIVSAAPAAKAVADGVGVPCIGKPFRADTLLSLVARLTHKPGRRGAGPSEER
jgi:CheY-like chemotaxis protein